MKTYKISPEVALSTLEKIAEEIPSGVSARDVGKTVTKFARFPLEIATQLHEAISPELKNCLDYIWASFDVSEKLEMVRNCKQGKEVNSSPVIYEELMSATNATHLRLKKEALRTKLKQIRDENLILERFLKENRNLIQLQMDEVKPCDFFS